MSDGLSLEELNIKIPETVKEVPKQEEAPPEKQKFRRVIDLGDGSGVQVFEAESLEELVDKLTEAQTHATRKIREQNQQLKSIKPAELPKNTEPPKPQPRKLSEEEIRGIADEMTVNPQSAFDKLFEAVVGASPTEIANTITKVNDIVASLEARNAAELFVLDHPDDYLPTLKNYRSMQDFLDENNLAVTKETLEYAFQQLKAQGKLDMPKPEEKVSEEPRIEAPQVEPQKTSTPPHSLSDRDSVKQPPADLGDIAEKIWTLPAKEARTLLVRTLRRGQV